MRRGIEEHWGGVGLAHLVCAWWPGFVDWVAWEDLVGLFGVGPGLGCVFGGNMVWHRFVGVDRGGDLD